jgi:hypothetical protein
MGFGRDEALRIQKLKEAERETQQWEIQKSQILQRDSTKLWEALVNSVTQAVQEFSAELPQTGLRAQRLNPYNLSVNRLVQPFVRLELIYDPSRYVVEFTRHEQLPTYQDKVASGTISMHVFPNALLSLVTAEGKNLSAEEAAQLLLTDVFRFFGR